MLTLLIRWFYFQQLLIRDQSNTKDIGVSGCHKSSVSVKAIAHCWLLKCHSIRMHRRFELLDLEASVQAAMVGSVCGRNGCALDTCFSLGRK